MRLFKIDITQQHAKNYDSNLVLFIVILFKHGQAQQKVKEEDIPYIINRLRQLCTTNKKKKKKSLALIFHKAWLQECGAKKNMVVIYFNLIMQNHQGKKKKKLKIAILISNVVVPRREDPSP